MTDGSEHEIAPIVVQCMWTLMAEDGPPSRWTLRTVTLVFSGVRGEDWLVRVRVAMCRWWLVGQGT